MAGSPSHKFGQVIGNIVQLIIEPLLIDFAKKKHLYLDFQQNTRKARKGKKVAWEDQYGNIHDLDYVLERNGTDEVKGIPVAFIEVAWRRYTKHSRNKAQEIQGAILPLAEKYQQIKPYLGVILFGEFTHASLEQLRSFGFHVLYFPYENLKEAFSKGGVKINFNENTEDKDFEQCVYKIENISRDKMNKIKNNLINSNKVQIDEFMSSLNQCINRFVEKISIIPLFGNTNEFDSIKDAVIFLNKHSLEKGSSSFSKYEVIITFSNGDRIDGSFRDKINAIEFLNLVSL